jgi:tripeptidyl-peptidase I
MLILSTLLSATIGIQAVFASPTWARTLYKVKETHLIPRKWTQRSRALGSHMIHMQIGLKQSQFDELERHLYEGIAKHPKIYDGTLWVWDGIRNEANQYG